MATRRAFSFALAFSLVVALVAIGTTASAQEVTASIVGTVTDPSNAPINGADVTATDTDRGTVWSAKTNDSGAYNILRLPVGNYTVKVSASGFSTSSVPSFALVLNQTARVDVQMKVGQVSESVEVTGAAPVLQTDTTEVSTLIDAHTIDSLALATRDYLQLTLLTPGATSPNPGSFSAATTMDTNGRPFINGNREQANLIILDGIDNSEDSNNEVAYMPNIDAIQEFNVVTQNASAEFGNYQGGIVSATVKSGTNNFHGNIFEYLRNDKLNANSWANDQAKGGPFTPGASNPDGTLLKTKLRWNMFGGTFGGPIIKNKLFFFGDFQGQRFDFPQTVESHWVFTDAERNGDFGALLPAVQLKDPTNGNTIPNNNLATYIASPANTGGLAQSPVSAALFSNSAYPHASNQSIGNPNVGTNFQVPSSSAFNNNQGDVKIDYKSGGADSFSVRYSQMRLDQLQNTGFKLNGNAPVNEPGRGLSANWTHAFTPTLLNEFRTGFNVVDFNQNPSVASLGNFAEGLGISGGNTYSPGMPLISFSEGGVSFGTSALVQIFHTTTGQISDTLAVTHGRHNVKTGFQYWRLRLDDLYASNQGVLGQLNVSSFSGSDLADFWLGSISSATRGSSPDHVGRRGNLYAGFVQDDWRITNALTLNLGLRFEDHSPFYEIHDAAVNFGLFSGAIEAQQGKKSLINNYLGIGDLLPRIGFAWSPEFLGSGKTVIRGAYGISEYGEGSGVNQQLTQNRPFFGGNTSIGYPGFGLNNIANGFGPPVATCATPIDDTCYAGQNIHVWDPNWRPALAQQWNLTIQRQLTNTTSLQLGYVGQHGTHLLNYMQYSQHQMIKPPVYDSAGNLVSLAVIGPGPYFAGNPGLKSGLGGIVCDGTTCTGGVSATTPVVATNAGTSAEGTASNSSQRYDALQVLLRKQMSNGLEGQVAYTYSKCMTNSGGFFGTWGGQSSTGQIGWQNVYDPAAEWGPCYFDETHILSSFVTYQLPIGRGKQFGHDMNSIVNGIIGGWDIASTITLHTGNALSTNAAGWGNPDVSQTGGPGPLFFAERASCLGSPHYVHKRVGVAGASYYSQFDSTNFIAPVASYYPAGTLDSGGTDIGGDEIPGSGTFGTCRNGDLRGPGLADIDLALHKAFPIGERRRLEFRTDFTNVFNHPILNSPNLTIVNGDNSGFGRIGSSQLERNIQFALKLYF